MRCVHEAARLLEKLGIGQFADRSLEDEGRLVAVEERPVQPGKIMGGHPERRRRVAHELVSDQQQHEWRPSPHDGQQAAVGQC